MAHLVEIYKGLSKALKVHPIQASDLPKTMLDAYIENTLSHYKKLETRRRQSVPASLGSPPPAAKAATNQRRLRRRTLATIGKWRRLLQFEEVLIKCLFLENKRIFSFYLLTNVFHHAQLSWADLHLIS